MSANCIIAIALSRRPIHSPAVPLPRFNSRSLYLLALFQLVAGPLVLMLVVTFCKVTVRELPEQGVAKAMSKAWHSDEVQAVVHAADKAEDSPASPLSKATKDKVKIVGVEWQAVALVLHLPMPTSLPMSKLPSWTPSWPQAPPGTPPRV